MSFTVDGVLLAAEPPPAFMAALPEPLPEPFGRFVGGGFPHPIRNATSHSDRTRRL